MPGHPNILLIMSDEHAPQATGCYGAPFVHSPNLDRLAAEGTTFDNAYCNFALCVPSRNSFQAGLLPWRIRAYDNGSPLSSSVPTWAHMLRRQGYQCILDGKMHMRGPDQLHGFHRHVCEGGGAVGGYRWGEERPSATGYRAWSDVQIIPDEDFRHGDLQRRDAAVEFIDTCDAHQPFCLCVGYSYPHYPMRVTESAFQLYDNVEIPPPAPAEPYHPRNEHWCRNVWGFDRFTPDQVRRSRQAYLAMVTMLDQWVGDVLESLERRGILDDTIVIYTSDHGDMWGEHGLWGKNIFYDPSSRVPLIVRAPSLGVQRGARVPTPVSLVDLYPTLRDVVGADDWDVPLDGRSLWGACTQGETLAEEPVFCEYYSSDTRGPERMIRLGRWKLNYYHGYEEVELFDIEDDPGEMYNLANDPTHAATRDTLREALTRDWDPAAIDADIRRDQNRRTLIGEALAK